MKSGNPAFFAGFPSEVEKSAFGLFHGASFPQPFGASVRFSYCSPPIIRIYDLSSVRYLLAMFRFSANHSVLADGIMRSCWRSFCGSHLNDRRTRGMTSQTAFKSTPGHAPARWQSHCARTRHLVIEGRAQDGLQTRPGSVVPAGTDGAGGPR